EVDTVQPVHDLAALDGVHHVRTEAGRTVFDVDGDHVAPVVSAVAPLGVRSLTAHPPTLAQRPMRHHGHSPPARHRPLEGRSTTMPTTHAPGAATVVQDTSPTTRRDRPHETRPRRTAPLTAAPALVRFLLRVDRIRALVWVLGIGALAFYFSHAIQVIAADDETLAELAGLYADPVGRMMVGPGFGMDAPTHERFFAAGYAFVLYIALALMS